jgi:hypothetical protein
MECLEKISCMSENNRVVRMKKMIDERSCENCIFWIKENRESDQSDSFFSIYRCADVKDGGH